MTVKVLLFEKDSGLVSKAIAHISGSDITHSAVMYSGAMYDSSEVRGEFSRANPKDHMQRKVYVHHIGASDPQLFHWLLTNWGKKYDWKGIYGWVVYHMFKRWFKTGRNNSKNRVYCHEVVADLIRIVQGGKMKFPVHVSGEHIRKQLGKPEFVGTLEEYLKHAN